MTHRPDPQKIRQALRGKVLVTRFAPSPTGYLHLGHVVNALYVWGLARLCGGQVLLRLEDHDRKRCRPDYEKALLQDLESLDLQPDFPSIASFREGKSPYRQSDRGERYQQHLLRLAASHRVYGCDCSRKQIVGRTGQKEGELRYDGFCRDRNLGLQEGLGWRVELAESKVTYQDLALGEVSRKPADQCGDLLLKDRDGNWTYQFAVVCDDWDHEVNCVIRGMDLHESSARQILLGRMLGRKEDALFLHHGLLTDANGRKLSKRDFAANIHQLLQAGTPATKIWAEAARKAKLITQQEELHSKDLAFVFTTP